MEKIFNKLMLIATSALALISCGTKDLDVEPIPERTLKTITFTTAICDESKATFETSDDKNFIADWVDGDKVAVAMFLEGQYFEEDADFEATWSSSDEHFSASVDPTIHDDAYQYKAIYPVGTDKAIEFGTVRNQSGNDYNGNYDVMLSEEITANLSTDVDIIFPMHRQTSIAYFHLTSDIDEPLVSAELEVTGGNIAGEVIYSEGELLTEGNSNKIITVFGEDAPNAKDFKLWFNVLPLDEWTNLKLTVKTATKVKVITNNNGGEYKKGCLYKVAPAAKVGGWADREGILPFDEKFDNITTGNSTSSSGSNDRAEAADLPQFPSVNNVFKAGGAIRLGKSGQLTTKALALEKDFTVWALIKGWSDSEKTLTVLFGDEKKEMEAEYAMTGDFSWKSVDFTGSVENTQISFTTASGVRVFIDRIYICPKGGEVPLEHNLELSAEEIVLGPAAGAQETFEVTSNFAWTSESTGSGFEFAPAAGEGNSTITVTASSNGSSEVATLGTITISDGELEKTITIKQDAYVAGQKTDNLTASLFGLTTGSSYTTISNIDGNNSEAVYAINANKGVSYIQLRNNSSSPSGIVSTTSGGVVKKVKVTWSTSQTTLNGRKIYVYGKNTAYELADLYDDTKKGTELGVITKGDNATETIEITTDDYEYVGLLAVGGTLYCDQIDITWGEGKAERHLAFFIDDEKVTATLEATYPTFTAPVLKDGTDAVESGVTYSSNNEDVAEVDAATGAVTLKKHGEVTITANVAEDETHKSGEASYTINVSHVLSGISLAEGSAHPTELYQNTEFNFSGIKLNANYNDGCVEDITSEITSENFTGYDMSVLGEQTVTITYNGKTTTYTLTILEAANLHNIDYSGAADSNGNSVSGVAQAAEDDDVTLTISLAEGYYLTSLTVDGDDKFNDVNDNQVTFTMGDHDVAVVATFSNEYTVTFTPNPANGTVTINDNSTGSVKVAAGTIVNVVAEPSSDKYELDEWIITGATLTDAGKATTSFTMPNNDVNVSASFKEKPTSRTVTLTTANYTWTDSAQQEVDGVTFNFSGGSTNPSYYSDGLRTYEGCAITISSTSTSIITSIAFTYTISNSGSLSTNTGTWNASKKTWSGSANSVKFTVGHSSGTKNGQVRITEIKVIVGDGSTTEIPVTSVTLDKTSTSLAVGGSETLTATVNPGNATNQDIIWKSDAESIVSVKDGEITAKAAGSAVITATSAADATKFATCTVTVTGGQSGGDPTTVTWVAKDASDNPGNSNDWFSSDIDSNISWSATKGGNNNPKYYDTGTGLRVYNGGSFKISAKNNKKITKIVLTFSGNSYTFSASDETTPQTYELNSVSSKEWSVSRTCRLQTIEVTYE